MQKVCCIFNLEYLTQWAGAYFWLDELSKEVRWYPGHQGQCGNNPQCLDKSQNSGFLRKSIFCVLGGPKTFLDPQKPYSALETSLLGGYYFLIRATVLEIFRADCAKK